MDRSFRKLVGLTGIVMLVATAAFAAECDPAACIRPWQVLSAGEAMELKRGVGNRLLFVDIRPRAETYFTGIPSGVDVHVPFMEPPASWSWNVSMGERELEFRPDFATNLDQVLFLRQLRHDWPVILMCGSAECAGLAALRLREHGYTNVYIVRDGFVARPMASR